MMTLLRLDNAGENPIVDFVSLVENARTDLDARNVTARRSVGVQSSFTNPKPRGRFFY